MERHMTKSKRLIALVVLGLGSVAASVAAQEPARQEPQVVRWQVELADGTRAKLMAQVGDTNRVTRPDGSSVAFSPFKDQQTGEVRLRVYEVVSKSGKGETQRLIATVPLNEKAGGGLSTRVADFTITSGLPDPKPANVGAVAGIPLSDRVIHWELTLADGRTIRLAAQEGGIARVKMADGQTFGLVPVARGDQQERVEFRLFSVAKAKNAGVSLRFLESFSVEDGGDYFPNAWEGSLIKISKVTVRKAGAGPDEVVSTTPDGPQDLGCCVTCSGTRACGCSVEMDCGDCCIRPCCYESF